MIGQVRPGCEMFGQVIACYVRLGKVSTGYEMIARLVQDRRL